MIAVSAPVRITGRSRATWSRSPSARSSARAGGSTATSSTATRSRDPVPGAVGGETRKLDATRASRRSGMFAAWLALWLACRVSSLLLGLALLWLAPRAAGGRARGGRTATGPAIGVGLAVFIGLPIVAVLLMITLVGIPLGIVLLLALLPLFAIGYTTSAWLLGRAIVSRPRAGSSPSSPAGGSCARSR